MEQRRNFRSSKFYPDEAIRSVSNRERRVNTEKEINKVLYSTGIKLNLLPKNKVAICKFHKRNKIRVFVFCF